MKADWTSSHPVLQTSIVSSDCFVNQLKKSYQADQQVKYLYLQAEIDLLLHQVKNCKQGQALRGSQNSQLKSQT